MKLKLKDIYRSIVESGIRHDPCGEKKVKANLKEAKKNYSKLSAKEKKTFDKETLTNPFSDSRILYGNPNKEIKNVLAGIDIETAEVLLAEALRKRGKRIDLILSHHPEGSALSALYDVMHVQLDILKSVGVSSKKAKKFLDEKKEEVA